MSPEKTFSKTWFVTWAATIGWAAMLIMSTVSHALFNPSAHLEGLMLATFLYTITLFPLGFFICFMIATPILSALSNRHLLNVKTSIVLGACFGFIFKFPYTLLLSPHTPFMTRPSMVSWGPNLDFYLMLAIGGLAGYVGYKRSGHKQLKNNIDLFH